jgi:hypothetical protein
MRISANMLSAQLDDTMGEDERGRCNDPLTPPTVSHPETTPEAASRELALKGLGVVG